MRVSPSALASGRLLLQGGRFGFGHLEQVQVASRDLEDQQVAEVVEQVGKQPAEVLCRWLPAR